MYRRNIIPGGEDYSDEDDYDDYKPRNVIPVQLPEENFHTTLQYACRTNSIPEIDRALKSKRVGINDFLDGSWTALMHACFNGSLDAVRYLLENGADPLIAYNCHNVIMSLCNCNVIGVEEQLVRCLKLLFGYNINVNAQDRSGMTALMFACSNRWIKLVEILIQKGSDLETTNHNGETALFFAVRSNSADIVKLLLTHGANKDAEDKKHQTIFNIAENKGMIDILNILTLNYSMDLEEMCNPDECTYWDQVMNEFKNGFNDDVKTFLENLSMAVYTDKINSKCITFKDLLTSNESDFIEMGIILSPHRKLLETAIKIFHTFYWSKRSLGFIKNETNGENIVQNLANITRQLHILDASLKYLGAHSYSLNTRKGEDALKYLTKISSTERKIFKILEKQIRMKKVDYIGPSKIKVQSQSSMVKYFLLATTAVTVITLYQIYK
ncbi:ankyrin repeat, SAM and basic leucine zipper domain-containing protein 1-like [Adelges cooleyi]|uniref:ankyrin repeat, SAM and basic leucine zipper domain-containing protein 1-like n=1 Tax=Adelges cooleyi TaxID=133065 RepID=UPI0021802A32|nr:ankyrin repeat, SAM and basic leucine zipper domain-containing protein 1-like [Adelges cooleyi]